MRMRTMQFRTPLSFGTRACLVQLGSPLRGRDLSEVVGVVARLDGTREEEMTESSQIMRRMKTLADLHHASAVPTSVESATSQAIIATIAPLLQIDRWFMYLMQHNFNIYLHFFSVVLLDFA